MTSLVKLSLVSVLLLATAVPAAAQTSWYGRVYMIYIWSPLPPPGDYWADVGILWMTPISQDICPPYCNSRYCLLYLASEGVWRVGLWSYMGQDGDGDWWFFMQWEAPAIVTQMDARIRPSFPYYMDGYAVLPWDRGHFEAWRVY